MAYEIVMGIEVHVELSTATKIFCNCTTKFGGEANTHCCPVCMGMPGTLPVLNKNVVEYTIAAGLATNCQITPNNKFDRKNYFYPDLPKAYQISQLYYPICHDGHIDIEVDGVKKAIRIKEIHMEEDAGKLIHDPWDDCTQVDYNRCGVPLIEIVSEADFRSEKEVVAYLEKLKSILQFIGVSDCKMQEGSLRADINLSVMPAGSKEFGTRTEMKNMNSFKAIARAILGESKRQIELLEEGGTVVQETRRWDDNKGTSFSMRSKENAQDYRYFPEPDLIPIEIDEAWIARVKARLPELPDAKKTRYMTDFGLSEYDANILISSKYLVDIFEKTVEDGVAPKEAANWIMGDLMKKLNDNQMEPEEIHFETSYLAKLIKLVEAGVVNRNTAKKVFEKVFDENVEPEAYIEQNGLKMVSDDSVVKAAIEEVLAANEKSVGEYKAGNQKALKFLMGQSMGKLKGKANPQVVSRILNELLN